MTSLHWSLTGEFPLCSMGRNLFTHWDLCSVLDSIRLYWRFPHICRHFSLLVASQRVSFMYYFHLVHVRDAHGHWFMNILFIQALPNHQYILLYITLDDERCLNSLLSAGLLPSTSNHLFWNGDIES
jgi:hypothetical protein